MEAGLRTDNIYDPFPEEVNRRLISQLAQLHFAPTEQAAANEEGVDPSLIEGYVPYQDSKLTMLLSPALGGDAKTTVVVTASMDSTNATETLQALHFGEVCGRVENSAAANVSGVTRLIAALDEEMAALEIEIKEPV